MDDRDQMGWKKLEDYVKENIKLIDPGFPEVDMTSEKDMLIILAGIINGVKEIYNPLTFTLIELKGGYETALWDESIKEKIVSNVSIVEEHCKKQDGHRVSPYMLRLAHKTVHGFGERLTEFDVDQQEQITKVIESLHKDIVISRRRC